MRLTVTLAGQRTRAHVEERGDGWKYVAKITPQHAVIEALLRSNDVSVAAGM